MTNPKKPLESMTTEELLVEMKKMHEKIGYTPEELKVDSDGAIILDPQNDYDKRWIERLEEWQEKARNAVKRTGLLFTVIDWDHFT